MGAGGGDSCWFPNIAPLRPDFRIWLDEPGSVTEVGAAPHVALIVADLPRTDAREYLL